MALSRLRLGWGLLGYLLPDVLEPAIRGAERGRA